MSKKIILDKISGTKNALLLLLQAPTHHGFTLNSPFLHELKHKVRLSETVCEIFHFQFCFTVIKVYFFVQRKIWTL